MRIVLTPFGSRGDVQPMLALGLGLRCRGHDVVVGAAPSYRAWIEELGLEFAEVGGDFEPWLRQQSTRNPFTVLKSLAMYLRDEVPLCFSQTCDAVRGADMVVTTIHLAAHSASEAAGVPCRTILYTVQLLPSRFHPPVAVPSQGLPGWLNRLLWWATTRIFSLLFRGPVNRERTSLGLRPIADFLAHARGGDPIVAADTYFTGIPRDVPSGPVQTGALVLPAVGKLDPQIEHFVQGGEPPIYVGFGSTPDKASDETGRLIVEAVRACGRRAIISAGWAGLHASHLPPEILLIREAPHSLLFRRVAVAVHHGGAGTTAAACRAGVPQVVVPHLGDQFFHGRRVRDLGVGPDSIPRGRLTAQRLAAAINEALNPLTRTRAQALAGALRDVDGVTATIDRLLESTVAPPDA